MDGEREIWLQADEKTMWWKEGSRIRRCYIVNFENERGVPELRNVRNIAQEPGKDKETDSSLELPQECALLADTLILAPWDSFQISGLQIYQRINSCCFKIKKKKKFYPNPLFITAFAVVIFLEKGREEKVDGVFSKKLQLKFGIHSWAF